MKNKEYLNDMPCEKALSLIKSSDKLHSQYWERQAEDNGYLSEDTWKYLLGKDCYEDIKVDSCSYTWWANIKPGHYSVILEVTDYDYFSEEDAKELKRLQKKVKSLKDKVENLEDCDDYYDKIAEWEDKADELADKALQIVVAEVKNIETVTEDQVDELIRSEWEEHWLPYYIEGGKTDTIYEDITKSYNTSYKEE